MTRLTSSTVVVGASDEADKAADSLSHRCGGRGGSDSVRVSVHAMVC